MNGAPRGLHSKNGMMTVKNLDQMIGRLPPERRAKIAARANQLIAEEHTLRRVREAHGLTQTRLAEIMHVGQDSVSRIESRSDLLLSTLRSYVQAMGGSLRLIAEFPEGVAELSSLGELGEPVDAPPRRHGRQAQLTIAHSS